jgi:hypothetical protein
MSLQANQPALTHRHRAMLRAVYAGRGEALSGRVPGLLIDGLFCDFVATGELFRAGSSRPARTPWTSCCRASHHRWAVGLAPSS